jgi:starch phosphorylase
MAEATTQEALEGLAFDLRWTWMRDADDLWRRIDAERWEQTRNPWLVLQSAGSERIATLAKDPAFAASLERVARDRAAASAGADWFAAAHAGGPLRSVAYFCMEFGLTSALPIYAGGLGVLAGDHLKAACELGVPLTAVGLLYYGGYFRQTLDEAGRQRELYPPVDPAWLPLRRVLDASGAWLGVPLSLPGRTVTLRAWEARIGAVTLYLLDSNDLANTPDDRRITSELYGGGPDVRLRQELALGVGGWRLLKKLGIEPDVCHCNEGHAAFATVERARTVAAERGWPFDRALAATRPGNVFTTHTAVMAGFDRFDPALIDPYLAAYAAETGVEPERVWRLGHEDGTETFNMAQLAIHGSGRVNAVSRLHGDVSRHLFAREFPRWPSGEVPVDYVTNGVHHPTWMSAEAAALQERGTVNAPDADLWALRSANRARLVATVRERGFGAFDERALTIGWARRFAAYKRPTLLLSQRERLVRMLADPDRPVQIVVAGKAHPRDVEGKELLHEWAAFAKSGESCGRVAVLADYDMDLAHHIVQGVDLWLNTPRRPWEASGTSGMKVLPNGGLNLSESDGWWAEARSPEVGWTFGAHGDEEEGAALLSLLADEVVPAFFERDGDGMPRAWLARMRASMTLLTPRFSADRMVRQYVDEFYVPAAAAAQARLAGNGALAAEVAAWAQAVEEHWAGVRFEGADYERTPDGFKVTARVDLGALDPRAVRVQLVAYPVDGEPPDFVELTRVVPTQDGPGPLVYRTQIATMWPIEHYTTRVVPYHPAAAVPLEQPRVAWER